jgi:hypothetical protein
LRIGYLDCFAGASGDMILGALIDAGLPLESLTEELKRLPLSGYQISAQPATRGVITGTQVTVQVSRPFAQATPLSAVLDIIDSSTLSPPAKKGGQDIFQRLAAAEARVHRVPLEEVRMHQVGAVDAIVDVMGAVIGLELMGLEALYSSPLPSGSGIEDTDHGIFPIPAPATLEILAEAGAPLRPSPPGEGELLTPTGAAIITTLASFESPLILVERIGYGAGSRNPPKLPNVLPLWVGESAPLEEERELMLLETNIDDMTPELFGHIMEQLFQKGALDVWFTPVQMKKNRPGVMLSVLSPRDAEGSLAETILRETSTLGLRRLRVGRREAEREVVEFASSLGRVRVKLKRLQGDILGLAPEFEDCSRLAREQGRPLQEVYQIVMAEARDRLLKVRED